MRDCVPETPWLKCSSCGCGDYFLAQGRISGKHWLWLLHPGRFLTSTYKWQEPPCAYILQNPLGKTTHRVCIVGLFSWKYKCMHSVPEGTQFWIMKCLVSSHGIWFEDTPPCLPTHFPLLILNPAFQKLVTKNILIDLWWCWLARTLQ